MNRRTSFFVCCLALIIAAIICVLFFTGAVIDFNEDHYTPNPPPSAVVSAYGTQEPQP